MSAFEFITSSLALQVALGGGYLGYVTAYAGLRRGHDQIDSAFISIAFGVPALMVFKYLESASWQADWLRNWVAAPVAVIVSLLVGALWRAVGAGLWRGAVAYFKVHQDDGTLTAWDALIQKPRQTVDQLSVHTKDGRTLYMNTRDRYLDGPHRGLILGGNGDIVMVVEEERIPGKDGDETRTGIVTDNGTRLTYLPASEIARVNIRVS